MRRCSFLIGLGLMAALLAVSLCGCAVMDANDLYNQGRSWSCEKLREPATKAAFDAAWETIGDRAYQEITDAVCGEAE